MIQFDAAAFFRHIGGPAALRRALTEDAGSAPAEATVAMWKSRNRIAAEWVAASVWAVLRRTENLTIHDLITRDDDPF